MTNAHELNGSLTRDIDAIAPREDTPREYIGASNVGSECEAEIAFSHRGFPNNELPPRTEIIFELGHMLENLILKHLKKANRNVWEKDGNTGKQYRGTAFNNHIIGNADGIIEVDSEAMLLEIKSMNDASFKKFKKHGAKISHQRYYAQIQLMLYLRPGDIPMRRAILVAYNKNNSEYWDECIEADHDYIMYLRAKIQRILDNEATKKSIDETDWYCKSWCMKSDTCWHGVAPEKKCSTCKHAEANDHVRWRCSLHDKEAKDPCDDYEIYQPKARLL